MIGHEFIIATAYICAEAIIIIGCAAWLCFTMKTLRRTLILAGGTPMQRVIEKAPIIMFSIAQVSLAAYIIIGTAIIVVRTIIAGDGLFDLPPAHGLP